MYSGRYFCPILTKFGIPRHIFVRVSNIKFYGNPSSWSRTDTCEQTDRKTYRRTDMTKVMVFSATMRTRLKLVTLLLTKLFFTPSCKFIIRMTDWLNGEDSAATLPLGTRETGCGFLFCVQVYLLGGQYTYQTNNKTFLHIPTKELVYMYA
jgi:hypothetical protein